MHCIFLVFHKECMHAKCMFWQNGEIAYYATTMIRFYQSLYLKPIALPRRLVLMLSLKDGVKLFFLLLLKASTLM